MGRNGMFNQNRVWLWILTPDLIGSLSNQFFGGKKGSFSNADGHDFLGILSYDGTHFCSEIECITDKSILTGCQVLETGISRIGLFIIHCDRALHKIIRGYVF